MRLAIIATSFAAVTGMANLATGCDMTQRVSGGTVSLTKSIFYKEIKTLYLGLPAREAINKSAQGIAFSMIVCIYQLRDRKAFDSANYQSLFTQDSMVMEVDPLAQRDVRVRLGEGVAVDIPLENEVQYVAVVEMFTFPDQSGDLWHVVLCHEDLDPDKVRAIKLNSRALTLLMPEDG